VSSLTLTNVMLLFILLALISIGEGIKLIARKIVEIYNHYNGLKEED